MEAIISEELADVKKNLLTKVPHCQIIACHRNLVSVKVTKTKHRELTASIQFPKDYPDSILLVEMKSKVLSPGLLNHIGQICDQELKKYVHQKQEGVDVMKIKQKQGIVSVHVKQKNYFLKCTATVPDHYPEEKIELKLDDHNFPAVMAYYFISQAKEFARQAVEAPLKMDPKKPPFQPSPHFKKVLEFLIQQCAKRYPLEMCPICGERTLPDDPTKVVKEVKDAKYADRLFCGHVFHHGCLDKFMKTPPFHEGKKCPKCFTRIYHDKWNISPKLAEERWAHHEARQRELDEVVDFLS